MMVFFFFFSFLSNSKLNRQLLLCPPPLPPPLISEPLLHQRPFSLPLDPSHYTQKIYLSPNPIDGFSLFSFLIFFFFSFFSFSFSFSFSFYLLDSFPYAPFSSFLGSSSSISHHNSPPPPPTLPFPSFFLSLPFPSPPSMLG